MLFCNKIIEIQYQNYPVYGKFTRLACKAKQRKKLLVCNPDGFGLKYKMVALRTEVVYAVVMIQYSVLGPS